MKTITIEMDESAPITAQLDDDMTGRLRRVAAIAKQMLRSPKAYASCENDPFLILKLERGAVRLDFLGEPGENLVIADSLYVFDVHAATCLAAQKPDLSQRDREDVLTVLGLLAGMYLCSIESRYLPPWEDIDPGSTLVRAGDIYEKLRNDPPVEDGFLPIKMADALVLRLALKLKIHPALVPLWEDLDYVTRDHRQALAQLMKIKP